MTDRGVPAGDSPRWNHRLSVSDCFVHDPDEEAGGGHPVAAGLNPPDPETVALVDLNRAILASSCSFPDPVVRAQGLDIETSLGFNVVAFQIDKALSDLFAAQDLIGALGRMRHRGFLEEGRNLGSRNR